MVYLEYHRLNSNHENDLIAQAIGDGYDCMELTEYAIQVLKSEHSSLYIEAT